MKNLILIAAIGENGELGKENKLIWYLPEDLKFFKEQTSHKPIVMGYNTFVSLPRLLPNRKHIVLTHRDCEFPEGVDVFHDKESLLNSLDQYDSDVYVIGGGSIYRQFLEDANQMVLTLIESDCKEADAFFPDIDEEWDTEVIKENKESIPPYKHVLYKKRKNID